MEAQQQKKCCCCDSTVKAGSRLHGLHESVESVSFPVVAQSSEAQDCVCSVAPAPPVQQPEPTAVITPLFSVVALLTRPAAVEVALPTMVLPQQNPIRGPTSVPLRLSTLAPDAGRAPPLTA